MHAWLHFPNKTKLGVVAALILPLPRTASSIAALGLLVSSTRNKPDSCPRTTGKHQRRLDASNWIYVNENNEKPSFYIFLRFKTNDTYVRFSANLTQSQQH